MSDSSLLTPVMGDAQWARNWGGLELPELGVVQPVAAWSSSTAGASSVVPSTSPASRASATARFLSSFFSGFRSPFS